MTARTTLKTLNVCGAGHSGSTLLGLVLGSHSACFYAGEGAKVRYLADETKPARKRMCKICGPDCPAWGSFEWDRSRPLYRQIASHVGVPVIIDTTKNPAWIRARVEETERDHGQPHLVFLTRDGRAVVNSRLRKYPDRDAEEQVRAWIAQIERSQALFDSFPGPKLRLQYEAFATEPATWAAALCELLTIPYEPGMLRFEQFDHHPLGGNNGTQFQVARARYDDPGDAFVTLGERSRDYYERHPEGIELDLRWKEELDAAHLRLFDRVAGSFNQPLAWEG